MNDATFVQIGDITYHYPGSQTPALKQVTLSIPRGASFGLLGPNGAGKTTLLSLLTGLKPIQQGRIDIAGFSMSTHTQAIKALSGWVPQEYAFYLQLTGRENLRFFADLYGLSKNQWHERLAYCSEVCRLDEILDHRTEQYSGGMKRRLNLAIGLLNQPQILYLDEPTVGIDAPSRQIIISAIQALRTQGTTLIYTSHYMEEIEAICDQLAIINRGQVVIYGSMTELLQTQAHTQLQIQLRTPPSPNVMQTLATWQPKATAQQLTLTVHDSSELQQILKLLSNANAHIEQLRFGASRLEQIYLARLGESQ